MTLTEQRSSTSTNTSDIANNNNFDRSETVNLNGIYAFNIDGPCTWMRVG